MEIKSNASNIFCVAGKSRDVKAVTGLHSFYPVCIYWEGKKPPFGIWGIRVYVSCLSGGKGGGLKGCQCGGTYISRM